MPAIKKDKKDKKDEPKGYYSGSVRLLLAHLVMTGLSNNEKIKIIKKKKRRAVRVLLQFHKATTTGPSRKGKIKNKLKKLSLKGTTHDPLWNQSSTLTAQLQIQTQTISNY